MSASGHFCTFAAGDQKQPVELVESDPCATQSNENGDAACLDRLQEGCGHTVEDGLLRIISV
jgi:hypothetical protein